MATERISSRMQTQIRSLLSQGHSIRKVARALGISRQSVRKYALEHKAQAVAAEVEEASAPPTEPASAWQRIAEANAKGVTVKQLHAEHASGQSYWAFRRQLRKYVEAQPKEVTIRLVHAPGERVEVDYADGISIADPKTGVVIKTHLFCAVLPFSSYTFGEFVLNQKLPSFIASQERMWSFLGGVTPYVVIDNLKAGVHKAHRYDPDLNPTYCDYANHTGFAVLPARPYKPRDKAHVEAGIGAIQRGFYQEVREQQFYSLATLNAAFSEYLRRFNEGVMKDHGCSRAARFSIEKQRLKALPHAAFELSEWRQCKVHPDCHVQVEKNFYSVPHQVVGQTVRVRIGGTLVEVFSDSGEALTAHARLRGTGRFSTNDAHYPDKKLGIKRFEVKAAQKEAEHVGPQTAALVASLISADYPLRHLRRIQGILRLVQSGHVTAEAMEYAATQALQFKKPRLGYIKACAEHFGAAGRLQLMAPLRAEDDVFLHGLRAGGEA